MQQRAMIAMALACQPKLLIADEPTTALDVTIQAQIIDLLRDLKASLNMSILLITHNFGIVKGFADEVVVMFRGKIVEHGPTAEVLEKPAAPLHEGPHRLRPPPGPEAGTARHHRPLDPLLLIP